MKPVPLEDFLISKDKPEMKLHVETKGHRLVRESSTLESLSGKKKKPFVVTVTDTSVASLTSRPTPTSSGRVATSFDCGEFWRYFQNASQLAFIVTGGSDAVIGRKEARQLLANFRGATVESISKTDSGLMHICGLSVRQLHDFVNNLWHMGAAGMSVIKDLLIGSSKGQTKALLLQFQKERIDAHIRRHSVSVIRERDDGYLELGADSATREELPSPRVSRLPSPISTLLSTPLSTAGSTPIGHRLWGDLDAGFEDEVKMDRPTLSVMESNDLELCKAEAMCKARRLLLGAESPVCSLYGGSFTSFKRPEVIHGPMSSISYSLTSWALESDVLSLDDDFDDDEYEYEYEAETSVDSCEESKCDSESVVDEMLSLTSSQWLCCETPELSHIGRDTAGKSPMSRSLSISVSERLATIMHAPVGV